MRATAASALDRSSLLELFARTFPADGAGLAFPTVAGHLSPPARAFVFGGVLRNAVLALLLQKRFPIRDVDYVVFGLASDDELYDAFAQQHPRRNSFGGLKIDVGGVTVDIWRAELEQVIAGQSPHTAEPEDFLHCVTLTTDAVLYDPYARILYERQFVRAITDRTIDVGRDSRWIDPWVPYHVAHLAYVRRLTGFRISAGAAARVRDFATACVIEQAVRYLEAKGRCERPRDAVSSLVLEARA